MPSLLFDFLFLSGLAKKEEKLLLSLLDWKEISFVEWSSGGRFPETKTGEIVIRKSIETDSLQTALDWSKQPLLIGRMESKSLGELFDHGLNYFLNLESSKIIDIPLEEIPQKKGLNALVVGPDPLLYQRIRAHLRAMGWETYPCKELSFLRDRYKEYEPGILFLDWERLNVKDAVDQLRNLPQRPTFPPIVGIRDVKRENLFQDLSLGIRDYCQELYSEKEILEILNQSIHEAERENIGSENQKRMVFEFRTGIQPTGIRIERITPTQFSTDRLEKIKLRNLLNWMRNFL
ncbi:response regulator [Leptospira sp. 201903071]|uniref:response regulator n=1 Tax=Leptospira ainazelensis TaxID=2810034 RepID=UPI001962B76D|nr:response regulator [Leptospira ainazelensis]MBM9501205.1 response regulator [Leptospira ainazelensis]